MPQQYLIWSIEHQAWWAPDHRGYTRLLTEAGRYSERDAEDIVRSANHIAIDDVFRVMACRECKIPVDAVDPTTESVE